MKLLVVGAIVLGAIGMFVWIGVVEGSIPNFRVHEFVQKPYEGECRIDDGKVRSIENPASPLVFTLQSATNPDLIIRVESRRNPPDGFKIASSVACRGSYRDGKFYAEELNTKCPSKYEASKAGAPGKALPAGAGPAASPSVPAPPGAVPAPAPAAEKGP